MTWPKKDRKYWKLLGEIEEYRRRASLNWHDSFWWTHGRIYLGSYETGKAKELQLWASFWYKQAQCAYDRWVEYSRSKGYI